MNARGIGTTGLRRKIGTRRVVKKYMEAPVSGSQMWRIAILLYDMIGVAWKQSNE